MDVAQPGDVIELASGVYFDDVVSRRDGTQNAPITIAGPPTAIVKGNGSWRILAIKHDYIVLRGFTVDGLYGSPESPSGYRGKLLYAMSERPLKGVTGLKILGMTFRNAQGECLRLRYFAQRNEIAESTFQNCGVRDRTNPNLDHWNAEAIYIGTHPGQFGMYGAPTSDPDRSDNNWIHHNTFNTQGAECVDIKASSSGNLVEHNKCTGAKDPGSPAVNVMGDANVIRWNEIYSNATHGIHLGNPWQGVEYGRHNDVYENIIRNNAGGGINFRVIPQGKVCGNIMQGNGPGDAIGRYASQFKPTAKCS